MVGSKTMFDDSLLVFTTGLTEKQERFSLRSQDLGGGLKENFS